MHSIRYWFFASFVLLLTLPGALYASDPLDQQLDRYLELTNNQPEQASLLISQLEATQNEHTPSLSKARLWSYLSAEARIKRDFAKAQSYIDNSLALAERTQSNDIKAEALTEQLQLYRASNQPSEGRKILQPLQEALNDSHVERIRYYAANTLGSFLQSEDRYEEALQAFYQAFHAVENSTHPRTPIRKLYLQGVIAGLNTSLAQYDKANEMLQDAINSAGKSEQLYFMLPDLYLQQGANFAAQNKYAQAEQVNQLGLEWARKLKNPFAITTLVNNLGDLRMKQGRHAEAEPMFKEALELAEQIDNQPIRLMAEFNLGQIAVLQGDAGPGLARMRTIVDKAYKLQLSDAEMLIYVGELADAYQHAGQYQQEAATLREYNKLSQRLFKADRDKAVSALQEAFSTKEKAKQIASLQQQNQLKSAEIEQKQLQQRVMLLFAVVILLATILLYQLYRKVRNANQQLKQANDQLAYNSLHDPLTGLLNRRSLQEFMQRRSKQTDRRQPVKADTDGFILLDIDHFKHINDHYGHAAGDAVLIELGNRLRQLTRQGDMVLRWGGEEFLIVLRNLNQTALTHFTNRVLQEIGGAPVTFQNTQIPVTASAGFLTLPFAGIDEQQLNWEKTLQLADMALYMGKVHGRNRAYGLVWLHKPYSELKQQLETDLSLAIEQGHLEITLVLGPPQR